MACNPGPRPSIQTPLVCSVEMRFEQDSQKEENKWFCVVSSSPNAGELSDVADIFDNWWNTNLRAQMSTSVSYRGLHIVDQNILNGLTYDRAGSGATGGISGNPAPNETSFCLKKNSATVGHRRAGRVYHIGLVAADITGNHLSPVRIAGLVDAYNQLVLDCIAAGHELVYVSYQYLCNWRAAGLRIPIIEFQSTDDIVDSQRRRKPGVGS